MTPRTIAAAAVIGLAWWLERGPALNRFNMKGDGFVEVSEDVHAITRKNIYLRCETPTGELLADSKCKGCGQWGARPSGCP